MSSELKYGMKRVVPFSYEEAVEKIKSSLKEQGFGVLTEIDVKATLKNKNDQYFTKYVILWAWNPRLAFQVLSEGIDIGVLLPCNVVVYEDPEKGETVLGVIEPEMIVQANGRTDLDVFAKSAREKLQTALDSVWA